MSSSTSETSQSEASSQEDKNYLEQSGSSEEKKRRKSKNKKKDKQKKKQKSKNKNKHNKKNKDKQKAYNKHRNKKKKKEEKKKNKNDKQKADNKKNKNDKKKNKNKNKNKKEKHSEKEKKITKLSQITQPVEKQIPKCENCNKTQSQFYCTMCEVFYCAKCEEQLHRTVLKKHKKNLYKAPYNELVKKTNFNICRKHNKELSLYCIDENKLICSECYSNCKINNHEILGLTDFSNEIYEKIKNILNKTQNEEKQNKETIQKSLENQNKLKEKIKNICKKIENDSDLLIQKIQDSKINYLNLFKKIEIIINTKIETILKGTEKKQKKILKKKIKINTIQKLKKDKKHIKIIKSERKKGKKVKKGKKGKKEKEKKSRKGNKRELGEKEKEEEKERESEKKDEFDPEMNYNNQLKLINENKTAWNPSGYGGVGIICGKKIYLCGKHEINIKIDQFPNPKNEYNQIYLGVIKTENRENFIKNGNWEGTYYFETYWNQTSYWDVKKKLESRKSKIENGKWTKKIYPEKIILKKNDIFTIFLDMDQKKISFKINEKNLEGWENLPQKVNFFARLDGQKGEVKNQITII
ncbi:tripartite motif-containing protein [Anaeramoeba flamelloides]|uniref:Tripartite motif-containing protein n=1 Tax=Anaeramoeba flamelloides TaxID=1746091 RepID=A0ABQ8ZEN3_9EUKA|nr:tripartite motif-containing protein [Anaeramoeba flamelloides]